MKFSLCVQQYAFPLVHSLVYFLWLQFFYDTFFVQNLRKPKWQSFPQIPK